MFGFNKVPHRSYKKNFLKTVVFQIGYETGIFDKDKRDAIINLFRNQFPRENKTRSSGFQVSFSDNQTPIVQPISENEGIELRSADGQKVLGINSTTLSLTISGNVYSNYNSLKNDLEKLNDFLKLNEISQINRLAIRKINIVEFKGDTNPNDVLNVLINPSLTGNQNYLPSHEKINHNIHSLNYNEGDAFLNIKYGLNIPPYTSSRIGQIIIDIDLFKVSRIDNADIFKIADEINSEIFNVFNWVISNKTLSMLNG